MNIKDLLPLEQWILFEKEWNAKSGLDVSVFNTEGIRITNYKEWVNRLCPVIKANDKGQAFICAVAHMNIAAQAFQTKAPVIEECDAGLVKLVVPIVVKDVFLGSVGACGLLLEEGEVDSFMVNRTIGIDEEEVDALSDDIGKISMQDIQNLAEEIRKRVELIVERYEAEKS